MSLLLLLACLCGAAARGEPTSPRCLPDYELFSYCRHGGLGRAVPPIGGNFPGKAANGPSLRRVNIASETASEKESPAAQPAARPQLSWRASAPEYGTFES